MRAARRTALVHILLILIVGVVLAADQLGGAHVPDGFAPSTIAWLTLGPMLFGAIAQHVILLLARRGLERTGSFRMVVWTDRVVAWTRWWTLIWHGLAVLGLGWLAAVRELFGDLILIDEMLAAAPAMLLIVAGWWSAYPVDRLLREAVIMRSLDEGLVLQPPLPRLAWVWMQVRHQMLLVLVPMTALVAWSELAWRLITWLMAHPDAPGVIGRAARWMTEPRAETTHLVAQVLAMIVVFTFMPAVLRYVWATAPLAAGPTREGLHRLCADHGVRIAGLLVWRTGGTMINGAVLGILGRFRYVLLTDALLESLPDRQIEAVMAHEVGHVRRRHVPWLAAALLGSVGLAASVGDLILRIPGAAPATVTAVAVVNGALAMSSLTLGLLLFGWVSRRFEWQADAFAVQHLSGARTGPGAALTPGPITPDAVDAMTGALDSVARLNHIPRAKFSWRHGSIQRRIDNLRRLTNLPADRVPVDRLARVIKLGTALAIAFQVTVWYLG